MTSYRFSILVTKDAHGWEAHCPGFPDCRARGQTFEDAVASLRDVIQILVEDGLGDDEKLPGADGAYLTTVELAV